MIPYDELCAALERHRRATMGEADAPPPAAPAYAAPAAAVDELAAGGEEVDSTGEIDLDSDVVE
jgi:hypothetical protein